MFSLCRFHKMTEFDATALPIRKFRCVDIQRLMCWDEKRNHWVLNIEKEKDETAGVSNNNNGRFICDIFWKFVLILVAPPVKHLAIGMIVLQGSVSLRPRLSQFNDNGVYYFC
jgi:hypothetical protein